MENRQINFLGASIYLKDINKYKVMTHEREREIADMILSGELSQSEIENLKKEMIEGNLKFVLSICKRYQNLGIDIEDLISEGNYGLLKAFDNFDWGKRIRFISYGKWWIKQAIFQLLNENSRTVRLPVNIIQNQSKIKDTEQASKELIEKNIIHQKVDLLSSPDKINNDIFIYSENDNADDLLDAQSKLELYKIIYCLDKREQNIIIKYFGLDCDPMNLEDIGEEMKLTKERVRQLKEVAIRKLRNNVLQLLNEIKN